MATIGTLLAELHAETASFRQDLGKATQHLQSFEGKTNRILAGMERRWKQFGTILAGSLSIGAITAFARSAIETGDEFAKLSERTGVSVEKLSEFSYGAKLAGVATQEMATGLQKLAQNMAEAASNRGSQAAEVFRSLGISATDANGRLKDTSKVFEELSTKFAGAADGANKVAIARALLGKTGDSLIPMMNKLSETSAEARKLGLTVSDDFAKSAERFNDHLSRMGSGIGSFMRTSIHPLINGFNSVMAAMEQGDRKRLELLQSEADEIRARMSKESGPEYIGTFYSDSQFNEDIERLREIDNETARIKARLVEPVKQPKPGDAGDLPGIKDSGQASRFEKLMAAMQRSSAMAQAEMLTDDREKAEARLMVARNEWFEKANFAKLSTEEQKRFIEQFNQWNELATAAMLNKTRSPMQQLNEQWQNTTRMMQEATTRWANNATDALTEFVMTGKLSFSDFANSIIRDLLRIAIQKNITGQLFASMESDGFFSSIASIFGGGRAVGGPVSPGTAYMVGEQGPEMFMPKSSGMIVPNHALGGGVSVDLDFEVNVINNSSHPVSAKTDGHRFDGRKLIQDVILTDFDSYGPIRTAISSLR